ncbi:hypothetical protein SK128_001812 [Halocaridina rubra]|uniref:Uncharacterized protein n=1 Tax=Halocaridina rubra TaxID=373956 RepID=A0AAN8XAJ0_HALRR
MEKTRPPVFFRFLRHWSTLLLSRLPRRVGKPVYLVDLYVITDVTRGLPSRYKLIWFLGSMVRTQQILSREKSSGAVFDHDNYCLEIAAASIQKHLDEEFVVSYCPVWTEGVKEQSLQSNSIGKCCPHGEHLAVFQNEFQCTADENERNLENDPYLRHSNITEILFTSFPVCSVGGGYHVFPLGINQESYAAFGESQDLEIVAMEHGVFERKTAISRSLFCLDYSTSENSTQPIAVVCPAHPQDFAYPAVENV